jgi:hypothetical protein
MKLLKGCIELIESPSGVFSLISLAVIAVVTWHAPSIGSGAFMAFFGIVPAALGYFEHKETMVQMQQPQIYVPQVVTIPPATTNAANPAPPTDPTSV